AKIACHKLGTKNVPCRWLMANSTALTTAAVCRLYRWRNPAKTKPPKEHFFDERREHHRAQQHEPWRGTFDYRHDIGGHPQVKEHEHEARDHRPKASPLDGVVGKRPKTQRLPSHAVFPAGDIPHRHHAVALTV